MRGKHDTVLEMCNYMMDKSTGKISVIDADMALSIKGTVDSMLRRQLRIVVLAYKIAEMTTNVKPNDNSVANTQRQLRMLQNPSLSSLKSLHSKKTLLHEEQAHFDDEHSYSQ